MQWISGAVKSFEDFGAVLSLGITGLTAYLTRPMHAAGRRSWALLRPGAITSVAVTDVNSSELSSYTCQEARVLLGLLARHNRMQQGRTGQIDLCMVVGVGYLEVVYVHMKARG